MILVIDNYDSFVHNLARYIRQISNLPTLVVRNDEISLNPDVRAVIISPGPCGPDQAGRSIEFVQHNLERLPMLGICLGHQIIIKALGGTIQRHKRPTHGKPSKIYHESTEVFKGIENPFNGGRYHSLVARTEMLPDCLNVTAHTEDVKVMAVEHHELPICGLQFHPESVLTQHGYQILSNFLGLAGIATESTTSGAIFA